MCSLMCALQRSFDFCYFYPQVFTYYLSILNKHLFTIGLVIDSISVPINEGKTLRGGMKFYGVNLSVPFH